VNRRLQPVLSELRQGLQAALGDRLSHVVLYGSQARGDASAGSDVDVLVVLRGALSAAEEDELSTLAAELSLCHDLVIVCLTMTERDYRTRQGPFLRNVRREGVEV
jgi:uncharacterized protein